MTQVETDEQYFDRVARISCTDLRDILDRLQPDDILVPNRVRNLLIYRHGHYVGVVNIRMGQSVIEWAS